MSQSKSFLKVGYDSVFKINKCFYSCKYLVENYANLNSLFYTLNHVCPVNEFIRQCHGSTPDEPVWGFFPHFHVQHYLDLQEFSRLPSPSFHRQSCFKNRKLPTLYFSVKLKEIYQANFKIKLTKCCL